MSEKCIPVDEMMRRVLSASPQSYYRSQAHIGSQGDFTTSPEISQLFSEIIALWCIEKWQMLGNPTVVSLVELGPGSGVLMRDLLKTVQKIAPEFFTALQVSLVEINPQFIKQQQQNLSSFPIAIKWLSTIKDIAPLPTMIIANEFFDALPIKQYIRKDNEWKQVFFKSMSDKKLGYDYRPINNLINHQLTTDHPRANIGAIVEISDTAREYTRFLTRHCARFSGAGLIIDYGYNIPPTMRQTEHYTSTLQTVKNHQYCDLLGDSLEADWSAHVDFDALNIIAKQHTDKQDYITQSDFLKKYGILLRLEQLKNYLPADEYYIVLKQVNRLIAKEHMGELFKVLEFIKTN